MHRESGRENMIEDSEFPLSILRAIALLVTALFLEREGKEHSKNKVFRRDVGR